MDYCQVNAFLHKIRPKVTRNPKETKKKLNKNIGMANIICNIILQVDISIGQ